jgi:hypothetical protein
VHRKQEELSKYITSAKPKKILTKVERKKLIIGYRKKIEDLSVRLHEHTARNINGFHINYKIHYLLHDPFTFVNAYTKISKNKGAMRKGFDDEGVMKFFGLKSAKIIANKLKKNQYELKPGKKKKRSINVPTQLDRIVQEAIRGILEAIYEPEFRHWGEVTRHLSNNYGFRPGMSTWTAMDKIKKYSQRCTIAIEGDIVSAYNNVNYDILLSILRQRIKDKKFLNLIKKLLKSGIMDRSVYEHSLEGTPQVGIVSPLLFNIYMFGLDKFVYNEIITPFLKEERSKTGDEATSTYRKIRYQTNQSYKRLQKLKIEYKQKPTSEKKDKIKKALKEFKRLRNTRNSTRYGNAERFERKAFYARYADDWVLALTCNQAEAEKIKQKIADYLKTKRKMQLDDEKTKISRVSEGYKFLGFEVRMLTDNVKQRLTLQKLSNGKYVRTLKRITSRMITIEPNSDRILNILKLDQFCNGNYEPRAKPGWLIYDDYDIVEKYEQIFRGLYNYYLPCERLTRLNRISYILQYSCARTLARRKNMSKRAIFKKYGKNLTMKSTKKENVTRTARFFTLTDLKSIKTEISHNNDYKDPFRVRPIQGNKN